MVHGECYESESVLSAYSLASTPESTPTSAKDLHNLDLKFDSPRFRLFEKGSRNQNS